MEGCQGSRISGHLLLRVRNNVVLVVMALMMMMLLQLVRMMMVMMMVASPTPMVIRDGLHLLLAVARRGQQLLGFGHLCLDLGLVLGAVVVPVVAGSRLALRLAGLVQQLVINGW